MSPPRSPASTSSAARTHTAIGTGASVSRWRVAGATSAPSPQPLPTRIVRRSVRSPTVTLTRSFAERRVADGVRREQDLAGLR